VYSGVLLPRFWRNLQRPSSGQKNKLIELFSSYILFSLLHFPPALPSESPFSGLLFLYCVSLLISFYLLLPHSEPLFLLCTLLLEKHLQNVSTLCTVFHLPIVHSQSQSWFSLSACCIYFSTLKMEAAGSSKTVVLNW
jgi:hypothetical protein